MFTKCLLITRCLQLLRVCLCIFVSWPNPILFSTDHYKNWHVYAFVWEKRFCTILFVLAPHQMALQLIKFCTVQPITLKISMYMYFFEAILFSISTSIYDKRSLRRLVSSSVLLYLNAKYVFEVFITVKSSAFSFFLLNKS